MAFVVSALGLIGVTGYSQAKAALPLGIMLASLGFLAGHQIGQAKR